jgi:hypothetical protein
VAGLGTWIPAGHTECPVYISLAPPTTSPLYHTVVHLACSQGHATTQADALANTWGQFGSGSGPANVQTWDGKPLYYYNGDQAHANIDVSGLLSSVAVSRYDDQISATILKNVHDGGCDAWAGLLNASLNVNGITSKRVLITKDNQSFAVNNVVFTLTNSSIANPYNKFITQGSGIPGQNKPTPYEYIFNVHVIVHPDITGAIYYDPSYGVTDNDNVDFTSKSLGAWENNANYWARPSDISSQILDFSESSSWPPLSP